MTYEPKTEAQIVARMNELQGGPGDFFGFQMDDLMEYISFEAAAPFIKDDAKADGQLKLKWDMKPATEEQLRTTIRNYLGFAWEKANNCRGISAGRSIDHFRAWLWLLGEEELSEEIGNYDLYGKPQLVKVSELSGIDFPWREHDDGKWCDTELDETGMTAEEALKR